MKFKFYIGGVITRVLSILGSLILSVVGAKYLSDVEFGKLTYFLSFVSWASVVQRFGLDRVSLRLIAKSKSQEESISMFNFVFTVWSFVQLFLISFISCINFLLSLFNFHLYDILLLTPDLVLGSTVLSLIFVYCDVLRGKGEISWGLFLSGVVLPVCLTFSLAVGSVSTSNFLESIYYKIAFVVLLISILIVSLKCDVKIFAMFRFEKLKLLKLSEPANVMMHSIAVVGAVAYPVIAIGIQFGPELVAAYQKSFLFSMVVGSVALIANTLLEPKFAIADYSADNNLRFKSLVEARKKLRIPTLICFVYIGAVWYFLGQFDFISLAVVPVLILCFAQIFNLLSAPFQSFYLMTGNAKLVKNTSGSTFLIILIFLPVLGSYFKIEGCCFAILMAHLVKFFLYLYYSQIKADIVS